jgi:hypothetical protein
MGAAFRVGVSALAREALLKILPSTRIERFVSK